MPLGASFSLELTSDQTSGAFALVDMTVPPSDIQLAASSARHLDGLGDVATAPVIFSRLDLRRPDHRPILRSVTDGTELVGASTLVDRLGLRAFSGSPDNANVADLVDVAVKSLSDVFSDHVVWMALRNRCGA
jgi:hypothetical protein